MLEAKQRRVRWLYVIPVLVLLLIIAGAFYALNQVAAASAQPPASNAHLPSLDLSHGPDAAGLKPGEKIVLPNGVIVGRDEHHDLSPPLRDIPPAPPTGENEGPENPFRPLPPNKHVTDPIVQRFMGPLAMPTPILTFAGVNSATSLCGCLPPDTNGDVGPNNYVQTVNAAFEIWDKNGTVIQTARAINTLFSGFGGACQIHNSGDPVVNYDPMADRWVISQFTSSSPYYQCVAVSQTGDPTGAYYRYAFLESATNLYDYPKMGVWPDAYYMTANVYDGATQAYQFPSVIAMDRSAMLTGGTATFQEFLPGNFYFALLPADVDGANLPPTGAREPLLTVSGNNTNLRLWNLHVDFATPANSHLDGPTILAAQPWDPNLCGLSRNCIPQPPPASPSSYLDSLGDHAMFRLAYRRFDDGHESLVASESVDVGNDQSGIRWYELRDPNGAPYIYQQSSYAPDALNRWMPSIAMDRDGNIAVGYSASSTTVFPSIRYAGRLASDPLNQLTQGEATLIDGGGSQTSTSGRWGDYSDMTVDPSDDCTFWYTQEYYPTSGGATWNTRIGKFKFPSCGQITPTPTPNGGPPTNTPQPTATSTPEPPPPSCANYTQATAVAATITPGVTDIGNHCDDCATLITLPFPVNIYGQTFTSAYASSNGVLNFGGSDYPFGNACLPAAIFSDAIAGYWDDLCTYACYGISCPNCGIFTDVTGTAPNRVMHIEWRGVLLSGANPLINFEIRLYETPPGGNASQVDIVYGTNVGDGGNGATVGLNGPSNRATQYECNTTGIVPGLDLTYTLAACPTATPGPPTSTPTNTPVPTNTPSNASPTPCSISFSDVHPTDYFYTPVTYLYCHGVISGYADGTFRPFNNTTRAQMVKIVVLGFDEPITTPAAPNYTFSDVPRTQPFFAYIETAAALNIVSGYTCGGTGEPCDPLNRPYFRPNAYVTRGQLSKIDVVAAGWTLVNPATGTFEDVAPGSAFYKFVETAYCHNVISGYSCGGSGEPCDPGNRPYFRQGANATRGQISKIVYLSIINSVPSCGAVVPNK